MRPFAYEKPNDEGTAFAAASAADAQPIAGGTSLVDLMRLGVETPARLVDVNALAYGRIEPLEGGGLRIGALVKNSDLAWHPDVRARFPALSEALLSGASPQLRNMASVGGNLLQRTRCAYFRDLAVAACNKRVAGSGCAAMDGWTRMHAILGTSDHCIAAHPSDMCVALVALDAIVHVRSASGTRDLAVTDFHVMPGDRPDRESVLTKGELVTGVTLAATPLAARSVYLKVRDRASFAFALASAAASYTVDGNGAINAARVALGGIATKPWRSPEAERALIGLPPTRATFQAAAEAALVLAKPRPGNAFKVDLAKRTLVRALERVGGGA